MDLSNIKPDETVFSLDIGTRSVIGTVGIVKEKKFIVIAESYVEHNERAMIDGQIHDITQVANAVEHVKKELEAELGFELKHVAIAAAGRFLRTSVVKAQIDIDENREIAKETIRGVELTAVKEAEVQVNIQAQGRLYCVGYSVKNYYLNGYIINNLLSHKGNNIAAEVIATFLPRSVVDSLYAVMEKVKLQVVALTLEPIAAMEAAIPQNLRLLNLALVDIGAGTSDIAISSKDSISAYGMVPLAGDEVTEAIAQALLLDFNTAEKIKREFICSDSIKYIDVLGFENEILREDIISIIKPTIEKICEEVSAKIIELNGGKSPNALFLVGGGAHTPGFKELIAEKLRLTPQRVAIKGRESIVDCICLDNSLGSTGVTVIGIALVCIKRLGSDFISVILNGSSISIFNSHKPTVLDVIIQSGINPRVLMGRNGKDVKFTLNGVKKIAFGSLCTNAKITINGKLDSVDGVIKEGDSINIEFSTDGSDAEPKIFEYVKEKNSLSFTLDKNIISLEPICYINKEKVNYDESIKNDDDVKIINLHTLGDYRKYFEVEKCEYYIGALKISDDYIIKEGDSIKRLFGDEVPIIIKGTEVKNEVIGNNISEKSIDMGMDIIVNNNTIRLIGKKKYIFVDIFNYIQFDLTTTKGKLILRLNESEAGYYDELKCGDRIQIYWEGQVD